MGQSHACALAEDGHVSCWGLNTKGQADAPSASFTSVTAGNFFSCGVTTGGTALCWGFPERYAGLAGRQVRAIEAGGSACAILADGHIECTGSAKLRAAPSGTFVRVSVGVSHACAVRDDGGVACWGANDYGQATPPPR